MGNLNRLFRGRVNRSTFFTLTLLSAIVAVLVLPLLQIFLLIIMHTFLPIPTANAILYSARILIIIVIIVLNYAICIRRLHDVGTSGWFALLFIIFNGIMAIVLSLIPGQKEANKYGKPPKPGIYFR